MGNEEFKVKCTKRINKLKEKGSTILFESHNLNEVKLLCEKVILLVTGIIKEYDYIENILDKIKIHSFFKF